MIGTNRDLKSIQRVPDYETIELKRQLVGSARDEVWISNRLAVVCRQRVAVCATLANGGSRPRGKSSICRVGSPEMARCSAAR